MRGSRCSSTGARPAGKWRSWGSARAGWRRRCCCAITASPVYASDTGTGAAYDALGRDARARPGAAVQIGGHDLERIARAARGRRGAGRAARCAAPGARAREAGLAVLRRGGHRVPGAPGGPAASAITGTNGKTTTTSLIAHAPGGGRAPRRGGGQHRPAALRRGARAGSPPDWLALELSSFQLHDTPHLKPAVGVLTNLAPNHLDRYHSLEEYYGDKALLFRNADAGSVSDQQRGRRGGAGDGRARCPDGTSASRSRERADGWYDRDGRPAHARRRRRSCRAPSCRSWATTTWPTRSPRRSSAAELGGADATASPAGLRTFRAIPHRVEPVREVDGVLWINDSKSHQHHLDRGRGRGARPALRPAARRPAQGRALHPARSRRCNGRCRAVVAYGEAGPIVVQDLGTALQVVPAGTFDEVIATARRLARPRRRGAAVARLLQLRHVQQLRGARRALPDARWRRCDRPAGASSGRAPLGDAPARHGDRSYCWRSASPRPTARPAWSRCGARTSGSSSRMRQLSGAVIGGVLLLLASRQDYYRVAPPARGRCCWSPIVLLLIPLLPFTREIAPIAQRRPALDPASARSTSSRRSSRGWRW